MDKLDGNWLKSLYAESFSVQMTACWCDAFVDAGSTSPAAGQTSNVENVIKIICQKIYLSHFYAFLEREPLSVIKKFFYPWRSA